MKCKRRFDKGGVTFKGFLWLLAFSAGIYAAYKFAPPYFSYYMLKTDVEEEAKNAHMYTDAALSKRIVTKAGIWSVPLEADNVIIDRVDSTIHIDVAYEVDIALIGGYNKTLRYDIAVIKPLKDSNRVLH